jgi:hypothetical protein
MNLLVDAHQCGNITKSKIMRGKKKKTLELPLEYLAKYGYKPEIKYKS